MVCKKCGAESVENATFCGCCGARLDGKRECKACGQMSNEEFVYCVYCGARMDGKKVCSSCGTAHDNAFCPSCGKAADVVATRKAVEIHNEPLREIQNGASNFSKVRKILSITGSGFVMLGVLFSLIFVFFIGVRATNVVNQEAGIFYYFGDYYKEIKAKDYASLETTAWVKNFLASNDSTMGVFGTLIGAISLVYVISFATVATVIYVRGWLGRTQRKADKCALACVISFFVGAAAFYCLHKYSLSAMGSEVAAEMLEEYGMTTVGIAFNSATKAGIVLCIVCVALFVVCKVVVMGRELATAKNIGKLVLFVLGTAFAIVVLLLVKNAGNAVELMEIDDGVTESVRMKVGFLGTNSVFGELFAVRAGTTENYVLITSKLATMRSYNVLAQIASILVLCSIAVALYTNIKNVVSKKQSSALVWWILSFVYSVSLLIFSVLSWGQFKEILVLYGEKGENFANLVTTSYVNQICAIVFSVLGLATSIVSLIVKGKGKEKLRETYSIE